MWECLCANTHINMYVKPCVWIYNIAPKSVKSYIAENGVLMQLVQGCVGGQCRRAPGCREEQEAAPSFCTCRNGGDSAPDTVCLL